MEEKGDTELFHCPVLSLLSNELFSPAFLPWIIWVNCISFLPLDSCLWAGHCLPAQQAEMCPEKKDKIQIDSFPFFKKE